jgi:hypothetical protein
MDPGTRYGDARLNWKLRNKLGAERPLFNATDDGGTLQLRLIDRFYRIIDSLLISLRVSRAMGTSWPLLGIVADT